MSFLVVNSARAASRAFHLNIRRQPDIMAFSRHQLDRATRQYIRRRNPGALNELVRTWQTAKNASGGRLQLGLTHHAVRLDFLKPYRHAKNVQFLNDLRDGLGINHIFFVVRPADEAFLSEFNRAIAKRLGNWKFISQNSSWPRKIPFESISQLDFPEADEKVQTRLSEQDMVALANKASASVGDVSELYHVFNSVFPNVHLVPYARLTSAPHELFDEIAAIAGFDFSDRSIADVKLNGLANRLLICNPLTVLAEDIAHMKARLHPRSLFWDSRVSLKVRFELRDVIEACNDWGDYFPLKVDCTDLLPTVYEDLERPIGLGLEVSGYARLSGAARITWQSPSFLNDFVGAIAPVFEKNYTLTRSIYRASYLKVLPEEILDISRERNGAQFDMLEDILQSNSQS